MPFNQTTEAYLMGIRDERKFLNGDAEEFAADPLDYSKQMLDTITRTLRQGFAGEMAEYMRGGRDFWANQVRKHS